ncbi:MAG: hypothetical protein LIO65_10340 [Odoribacter sp.]|nr:hypothetical protein [Odoribacter sp.]
MRLLLTFIIVFVTAIFSSLSVYAQISDKVRTETIETLSQQNSHAKERIQKGVNQVAFLWTERDGSEEEFKEFCTTYFISDDKEREEVFYKISNYMESLWGNFNNIHQQLQWNLHLDTGPLHKIDYLFSAYSSGAHLAEDFYNNKIAFVTALNFPKLSLEEKEALGNDRKQWAYARLGDVFTERIGTGLRQQSAKAGSNSDIYIASYNIYMGSVTNKKRQKLFPENMILLSHWNLRDEIKANYGQGKEGLEKQRIVHEVMKHIISQDIPKEVINAGEYDWNPYTNTIFKNKEKVSHTTENFERYERMLENFRAAQAMDKFTGNTFIDRKFNEEMEISLEETEKLFDSFLSAPELKEVGKLISKRLGRKLEPFDIWYDGFKARSNMDEKKLDEITREKYPDAQALKNDLPNLLTKLGFSSDRANYLAEKIEVDAARGSGHAWGAAMKGSPARLRTRIPESGLDYKGYNIAIHEFGHNVEQTISLYDVDYYMLNGVPNTAFTEALAFTFQKRDLYLLGLSENRENNQEEILDKFWNIYEIMGVSMLDISVWKWLYAHPEATAEELCYAVDSLSKEIWNKYYADVFGIKDQTILAIYSHMLNYPLYISAYSFGHIIEYQIEKYLASKDFATEVDRIFKLGRLTPGEWIKQATSKPLSVTPLLEDVKNILNN